MEGLEGLAASGLDLVAFFLPFLLGGEALWRRALSGLLSSVSSLRRGDLDLEAAVGGAGVFFAIGWTVVQSRDKSKAEDWRSARKSWEVETWEAAGEAAAS